MENIFNRLILNVIEDGLSYKYYARFDINRIPVYHPPQEKANINSQNGFEEMIFLPVSNDDFQAYDNIVMSGYKYIVYFTKYVIPGNPVSTYKFIVETRKLLYKIIDENTIKITKVYLPKGEPKIFNITNNSDMVALQVASDLINNAISENNTYHLNNFSFID